MEEDVPDAVNLSDDAVRTALWLHDEGYCVLPRCAGQDPARLWRRHQEQRPRRGALMSWLTQRRRTGIGVVVGPVSNLCVLDIDHYHAIALLRDVLNGGHWNEIPWYKTSRGLQLWFCYPVSEVRCDVLRRNGVELLVRGRFCECPPMSSSQSFHGPLRAAHLLPRVPDALIHWFHTGRLKGPGAGGSVGDVAAYYWSLPRAPIPTGQRNRTLFRVAYHFLSDTDNPYRVIAELVRRATRIDGLSEEEAIACCDDALQCIRRGRGPSRSTLSMFEADRIGRSATACSR